MPRRSPPPLGTPSSTTCSLFHLFSFFQNPCPILGAFFDCQRAARAVREDCRDPSRGEGAAQARPAPRPRREGFWDTAHIGNAGQFGITVGARGGGVIPKGRIRREAAARSGRAWSDGGEGPNSGRRWSWTLPKTEPRPNRLALLTTARSASRRSPPSRTPSRPERRIPPRRRSSRPEPNQPTRPTRLRR